MRALAFAAAAAAIALLSVADARPWADPAGRLTIDVPQGWAINQPAHGPGEFSYVIAGNANNECQFLAIANPGTASASPGAIRRMGADAARFGTDVWARGLGQFNDIFRNGVTPTIASTSVDTSSFWPIQRAEATAGTRPIHGALQMRPGIEIFAACLTYDGAEPTALYDQVIRSVAHPNDATWRAAAEAEAAAAPAPAAPAP
jgi:hypothetical protein